jgi:uncharacterized protein (DUF2236 family)
MTQALSGSPVLGRLDPTIQTGFDRSSPLRRAATEPVVFLLIPRALVMEVAHPKVGAGVDDHSQFRRIPLRRLSATMDAAVRLVFGDPEVATAAAHQIYRLHDRINGTVADSGEAYTAHDATLLLWVWATLVEATELGYTRWVRPLTADQADALYADLRAFGRFFGIPDDLLPADRATFAEYYESVLASPDLGSTATSRRLVRDILSVPSKMVPDGLLRPFRVLAVGLLDPRLRDRLGLSMSGSDERLFRSLDRWIPRFNQLLPRPILRQLPYVYLVLRRPPRQPVQAGTVSPPTGASASPE